MDIISHCPLRATCFEWQPRAGTYALTIICMATYELRPGECILAASPESPQDEDGYWNDDQSRSLRVASDRVPYKPQADILLVGYAFAPKQTPARSIMTRLVVGEMDKSIEVWCDRGFRSHDGQILEGPRIAKMLLQWEKAAGGPGSANPVGIRFDAPPDRYGMVPVPNLQPAGVHIAKRGDSFGPIGYGPIAPAWPGRAHKLQRYGAGFIMQDWEKRPLPDDFDYSFFNVSPPDQRIEELRANERFVLENLHPQHERLVTSLPNIQPRILVERATGEREHVGIMADTLWIDTERSLCTLVWRGRIGLRGPGEPGRISVTMDGSEGEIEELEGSTLHTLLPGQIDMAMQVGAGTLSVDGSRGSAPGPALPFSRGEASAAPAPKLAAGHSALPFGPAANAPKPVVPQVRGSVVETIIAPVENSEAPKAAMPVPMVPPPARISPPALVMPVVEPASPVVPSSPWASGGSVVAAAVSAMPAPVMPAPVMPAPVIPAQKITPPAILDVGTGEAKDAAKGGALAASNAAAEGKGRTKFSGRAAVELIWVNPGSMSRIRKHAAWKELLSGVKVRPEDEDIEDDVPAARRIPAKDRREVSAILSKGEPLDGAGIESAFYDAMEDEGGFVPPLVLVGGELEMKFDELETLKATLAAVSPHITGNKRLEEAVARVQEMMKMPWSQGASGVLEEAAEGIRKLYAEGRKAGDTLDSRVEQILLDQRHYRKRVVFGQPRLVGDLGWSGVKGGVTVYLPDSLGKELPSLRRMGVRMIGDVRARAEEGEGGVVVLRVAALGRVVG